MFRKAIYVAVFVCLASAQGVLAWGGRDHIRINRRACELVPDEMAAWRDYEDVVGFHGIDPDLWKSGDDEEGPRHYIDLENYGVPDIPLSREEPADPSEGIAPWVIMQTMELLSTTMREGDWVMAARIAAALGHYVADTHQPLHCTSNFDGQLTGNDGVHVRWESIMPKQMKGRVRLNNPVEAQYFDDPWTHVVAWILAASARNEDILKADTEARWFASDNVDSFRYFEKLWEETGHIFKEQASLAAFDLSSIWYTAWVNADKPSIPPPPDQMSNLSFHPSAMDDVTPNYGSWAFGIALAVLAIMVIGLSVRKQHRQTHGDDDKSSKEQPLSMKDAD